MTTGERMKQRRKEIGLSAERVAEILGVSPATVYRYENGDIDKVPGNRLAPIADALMTTPAYLMGWADETPGTVREIPSAKDIIPMPKMNKIPLLGTIACGEPILAAENIEDEVDIPEHIHADFALRCKGDSMIGAEIYDGDIVYIKQQEEVLDGQIAAVLIGDEATLKRFYFDQTGGVVTLVAENPSIAPLVYHGESLDHIKVLGKAVGLTRQI